MAEQPAHAKIDISSVINQKWAAFQAHRTQFGANHPFLQVPKDFMFELLKYEWFELGWPEAKQTELYSDLFADLAS